MAPVRYRTAEADGFKVFYREAGNAAAPMTEKLVQMALEVAARPCSPATGRYATTSH
jgi:hypothetical protein